MAGASRWALFAVAASACGRLGFDPVDDAATDAEADARGPFVAGVTLQVTAAGAVASEPSIAWTGERYLIAWRDSRAGNCVYVGAVDRTPALIAETQLSVITTGFVSPSVAWTGTELGVAWRDDRNGDPDIYFSRVDADARELGADVRLTPLPTASVIPSLVWNGTDFTLTYSDSRDGNVELYFARLAPDGGSFGPEVRLTNTPGGSARARLVATTSGYAVTYDEDLVGIVFALVSGTGVVTKELSLQPMSVGPSIAWSGSGLGVAFDTSFDGIQFAQVDEGANLGPRVRVDDQVVPFPTSPRIAWNGTAWGITWIELGSGTAEDALKFALIDPSGARIGTILDVATGPEVRNPDLIWADDHFAVTWADRPVAGAEIFFRQLL